MTLSTSSLLARVCAAIALSKVVPTLLKEEFERVEQIIQVLQVRIPGQAKYVLLKKYYQVASIKKLKFE